MKTKTINLYSFEELNEEQKAKVIDEYRDINTDYEWHDYIMEEWDEKLSRQGFRDAKIYYRGFYSQGDGASFTCKIDVEQFLRGRRIASKYKKVIELSQAGEACASIEKSFQYEHEYTMRITSYEIPKTLEDFMLEEAREQARKIYQELKKQYEYLISDEAIIETIEANEYLFNSETLKIERE